MGEIEGFVVLLIAAAVVAVVAKWIAMPSTLALLLLGLGIGSFSVIPAPTLSSDIILLLFLPPLLSRQLLSSPSPAVVSPSWGPALAVAGVVLAMLVGGALVHGILGLPWSVALLFGVMIAATDPVAVLATFRNLDIDKRLTVLMEGESLLNDGVALVLLAALVEAVIASSP